MANEENRVFYQPPVTGARVVGPVPFASPPFDQLNNCPLPWLSNDLLLQSPAPRSSYYHIVELGASPPFDQLNSRYPLPWLSNDLLLQSPAPRSSFYHLVATGALPPFDLLNSNDPLRWLPDHPFPQPESPRWPSLHLVEQSSGPPFLVESPGWYPSGGQLPQSAPRWFAPPAAAFITPTLYEPFPFVPPWVVPYPIPGHVPSVSRFDYVIVQAIIARSALIQTFVAPVAPAVTCALTVADLKTRVYEQLDDNGTYYTGAEVLHALNAAQNLFALISLCIERTVTITTTAATCFHTVSTSLGISDYLVPLRLTTASGARIRPTTVHEMDGLSTSWRTTAGTPTRYIAYGYDLMAFSPQPATATSLILTYAASPTQLTVDASLPEIPDEQHIWLVDYACWWLRLKEGGQELANATQWLQRFIQAASKYAMFVRRRSYGQKYEKYDMQPFDIASFDRGRLDIVVSPKKPQ